VVVTGVEDGIVRFHDPHGHPYATLPADDFIAAWRADSIGYATEPFTARAGFQRVRDVDPATALRRALPMAARWLADLVETGLEPWQHDHLGYFAIRVGARRLSDASACLAFIGESKAVSIAGGHGSSAPCNTRSSPATASPWPGCCGGWRRPMNNCGPACRAAEPAGYSQEGIMGSWHPPLPGCLTSWPAIRSSRVRPARFFRTVLAIRVSCRRGCG
jgi:hypothetical protein